LPFAYPNQEINFARLLIFFVLDNRSVSPRAVLRYRQSTHNPLIVQLLFPLLGTSLFVLTNLAVTLIQKVFANRSRYYEPLIHSLETLVLRFESLDDVLNKPTLEQLVPIADNLGRVPLPG
jgi:hypothetical protein